MRLKSRYRQEELFPMGFRILDPDTAYHAGLDRKRWRCVSCGEWVINRHRSGQCTPCFLSDHRTPRESHAAG